jgi:hypothetical protein
MKNTKVKKIYLIYCRNCDCCGKFIKSGKMIKIDNNFLCRDCYVEIVMKQDKKMTFKEKLIKKGACNIALQWVGERTMKQAFADCERGDWILWAHGKFFPEKKRELVLAAAHCANTVRHLMRDERNKKAVDAAILYGEEKISEGELSSIIGAADDAAFAAADYAALYAAASAYAANDAADAAYAAFCAAAAIGSDSDDYNAAKKENQKLTADICRKYLTI